MRPQDPTLDRLIREAEEARLQEAVLEATGEELLDRVRTLSQAVVDRVTELTVAPGQEAERLPRTCPPIRQRPNVRPGLG
jgi:hypothetical protein